MIYSEHLIGNFFITKPQRADPEQAPTDIAEMNGENGEKEREKMGEKMKTVRLVNEGSKSGGKINNVYKMITNKIRPSTAVSTQLRSQKSSVHRGDNKGPNFLSTFERFLKEYANDGKNKEKEDLKLRKRSVKKKTRMMTACTKSLMTYNSQDSSDLQDFLQDIDLVEHKQQKKKKLTYHQRIKHKITTKIDNIVNSVQTNKLSKIQTLDQGENLNVEKVLWLKNRSKKAESKMRVIRTGLPIRLTEMDPKIKNINFAMKEIQKARKDILFQKTMAKNCKIILSEIDNYKKEGGGNEQGKIQPKKRNSGFNYLRSTKSREFKNRASNESRTQSNDNLQQLRWTQKCLSIEWRCDTNSKKYRKLKKGLKIFEGFCNKVNKKLVKDGEKFDGIIQGEQSEELQYCPA